MTTHLSDDEKNNPFINGGHLDSTDIQLLLEATGLYLRNNSRLVYSAHDVHRIAKLVGNEKMKAIHELKPKYEGQPLSSEEVNRLDRIDDYLLDAMAVKEAEDDIGGVIYSLEEHLKKK